MGIALPRDGGKEWTLALLEYVPGSPLPPAAPESERIAGQLLGNVHAVLSRISHPSWVPARLLEWSAEHARVTDNATAAEIVQEITSHADSVTFSVVYGDPCPEILLDADRVGLIDWGTPSWGPQLHDIAAWLRWLGETPGSGSPREASFLQAYSDQHRLGDSEWSLLGLYGRYGAAFGF